MQFKGKIREYFSSRGLQVISVVSVCFTILGGIFVIPTTPGWLFFPTLTLLLISLHFAYFSLEDGSKPKPYHVRKLYEEYHAKYFIEGIPTTQSPIGLCINSISKHTYSIIPLTSPLNVMHHSFSVLHYRALACKHHDEDFLMNSLQCNHEQTAIKLTEFSDNLVRFRLEFVPAISPSSISNYSFSIKCLNSMFLSQEELFNAISNDKMPATRPFCFRPMKVDVPTDRVIVKVEFPIWYQIKNVAPLVTFKGNIIAEIQSLLTIQMTYGVETYTYSLEIFKEHLHVGFYYAISWLPPSIQEIQKLNKKKKQ